MKKNLLFLTLLLSLLLLSCQHECSSEKGDAAHSRADSNSLTIASWNVQTFFDAEIEGTEYEDFRNFAKWSKDKYVKRLGRLCEVMTTLNADVFVFEEIENMAVVQDIANQLCGNAWSHKNNWNYACFAKENTSAIGCAVFSKYELSNLKVHFMDIRVHEKAQPAARPVMQLDVDVDGKLLKLVVNHWKSKSGGELETEIWRDWQEALCVRLADELDAQGAGALVFCGDFNRDIDDFCLIANAGKNVMFRGIGLNGSELKKEFFSPWVDMDRDSGSYYYDGNWERIDHLFISGNLQLSGFCAKAEEPWCFSDSRPNAYKIYSGEGYSDHVPVMCVLTLY